MARTAITPTALTANGGTLLGASGPGQVTIDQANGMSVTGYGKFSNGTLFLVVTNTAAATHNVTISAGTYNLDTTTQQGAAFRQSLGNAVISVAASSTAILGPFENSRFLQGDNSLSVDFDTGTAGTIQALYVPRGA